MHKNLTKDNLMLAKIQKIAETKGVWDLSGGEKTTTSLP